MRHWESRLEIPIYALVRAANRPTMTLDTMVDQQAPESNFGFVNHLKNSLSIASRGARRPETFPKTAIYCHYVAAKPLRPFQPSHSIS
jgi:hypothetical protein